jgi:peroxiredoxin
LATHPGYLLSQNPKNAGKGENAPAQEERYTLEQRMLLRHINPYHSSAGKHPKKSGGKGFVTVSMFLSRRDSMVLTPSSILPLGSRLPAFELPDGHGARYRSRDLMGPKGLFVIFICNHCPYVKHINAALAPLGREFGASGVGMAAISSNDAQSYPEDAPNRMAAQAKALGYTFPYLYDETQEVARAFGAACTPDLYLFDDVGRLVYHGQFDTSRPSRGTANASDIRRAVKALTTGMPPLAEQIPSVGCSIKWKSPCSRAEG